ncbi:LacI family DNA-binding transcriptional regulator [Kaistia dalseonensis]|uniref:LacI family transcriptional regulator n=1 Tax=Kaistia dalseonensis TaxID=410840 RepID=A0ABU0H9Z9_9HYPH|nr:LacI family DNA-binding transcriptional regulator [Kaistia dalseonensis]MCX5496505.1 LacI family DNA-binding transcriptional regulator [Kaistia dalseonensis]MDQ0439127.1 LacI family transcriptional regulator [Kaistia dalseonensis]
MIDVAREAGVAFKTVSRVVNGEPVRRESLERVDAAIAKLGYRRNIGAASLRSGRSRTVGLLVYEISESFQLSLAQIVEAALAEKGYRLVVASTMGLGEREAEFFESFCANNFDGLIVLPSTVEQSYMRPELEAGVSIVFVDRPPKNLETDVVLAENREGMRHATEYLIAGGHRRIGFFSLKLDNYTGVERHGGYRDALDAAAVSYDERLVSEWPETRQQALEALDAMLALPSPPTAFLSGASPLAKRLLWAFRQRKITPPFVSYDDFELADLFEPPVTVVSQDSRRMGLAAVDLLLQRMQGDTTPPRVVRIPTHFIERGGSIMPEA